MYMLVYYDFQNHCTIRLNIEDRSYVGKGKTIQEARNKAAIQAVEHIKQLGGLKSTISFNSIPYIILL